MKRSIFAGLLLAFTIAGTVSAHEITDVTVDCDGPAITVTGVSFDIDTTVTVTGPGDYLASFTVESADFTESLPLGDNGTYSIDWPDSAEFGPVSFEVACTQASIDVPATSHPTMPPTDTILATGVEETQGTMVGFFVLLIVTTMSFASLVFKPKR